MHTIHACENTKATRHVSSPNSPTGMPRHSLPTYAHTYLQSRYTKQPHLQIPSAHPSSSDPSTPNTTIGSKHYNNTPYPKTKIQQWPYEAIHSYSQLSNTTTPHILFWGTSATKLLTTSKVFRMMCPKNCNPCFCATTTTPQVTAQSPLLIYATTTSPNWPL